MKTPLPLLLTIAAALSTSIATAQDGPPPRPPGDAPRREDERRAEGQRPPRPEDFERPPGRDFSNTRRVLPTEERHLPGDLPPLPAKPQAYLGVATRPLDPALSAQLGLTPGLGLIVEEVIPDSPAAVAGVQQLDVIKQINDQLVSNPPHLAALTRHFGKDAEVTLLVLRKGQEQKIAVKIGERLMREPAPLRMDIFGGTPGAGRPPLERRIENFRRNNDDPNRPLLEQREGPGALQKPSADLFREIGPGGAPTVQTSQDRVSTTWNTASAKVMLKDLNGEIEVRSDNGKRTLTAKNPKGENAFDGPIDTEEQRKAIPPEFRKMLEQVEVRSRVDRHPGGPQAGPGPAPEHPAEGDAPKPRRGQPEVQ